MSTAELLEIKPKVNILLLRLGFPLCLLIPAFFLFLLISNFNEISIALRVLLFILSIVFIAVSFQYPLMLAVVIITPEEMILRRLYSFKDIKIPITDIQTVILKINPNPDPQWVWTFPDKSLPISMTLKLKDGSKRFFYFQSFPMKSIELLKEQLKSVGLYGKIDERFGNFLF